jgi:tetratricopeptide (TPR) repeat protein
MPRERVVDGGHGVLTDHSIPRRPRIAAFEGAKAWQLAGPDMSPRELGLAYAELALRTSDRRQMEEAVRLLSSVPVDAAVAVRLADLYQRKGNQKAARNLYESALRLDPNSVVTLVNLGVIYASSGDTERAITLWREAVKRNPLLTEAVQNLRAAEALSSDKELH